MRSLKSWLKTFPLLVRVKRHIWAKFLGTRDFTTLNIVSTFPLYCPYGAGTYKQRAALTIQAVNQIFPFLSALTKGVNTGVLVVDDITRFAKTDEERASVVELKERLDFYGSDKANHHNYHHLYGSILCDKHDIKAIFEIGMGTNNTDVVSNMGASGKPGASLRAFRDYCRNARVYGADIDRRILFKEERIETFFVDQTDPVTFDSLLSTLPKTFDLVIDDGLHSPNANVESLRFGLEIVKKGGWVVIEDIQNEAICLWQVVAALLPSRYRSYLFNADGWIVFAVQRTD